ncbi:MAG: quinone-dependent dihydroorotate dehydrogenase, partial [Ignavibacteria bacterium]|nr:quinone-dependent dihydroorotate dehydrogenase [Ignavibacteria bacterium]
MLYKFARKIFFLFNPEFIHDAVINISGSFTSLHPFFRLIYHTKYKNIVKINNLEFNHPLGLAAGLDKDGEAIRFWDLLGFSFIEVGTVTPKPQSGNPKPRLFRLVRQKSLLNRMGFNNKGAKELSENIKKAKPRLKNGIKIGVNIGKNKITENENAADDYIYCLEKLFNDADYFVINISSPNTEGLRELQGEKYLNNLLSLLTERNKVLAEMKSVQPKEIFLKIAPDLTDEEITQIYHTAVKYKLTGIVATNTTIDKTGLPVNSDEEGGISGRYLKEKSDKVLKLLNELNSKSEY